VDLESFVTEGLGDTTYLVASEGEAALVDPQRDAWRFLEVAERRRWKVRYVLETHAHNDYVSGALETRWAVGARIVAPARGGYAFDHLPAAGGESIELGGLRLVARATPGHTFEHIAWEVHESDGEGSARHDAAGRSLPTAVFSGGSLLVGSAGRTDLLGPEATDELTRAQYRTLHDLATLPDDTMILPTHGAGSFCVANVPSAIRHTTVGRERTTNEVLLAPDEASFVRQQLDVLTRYPAYYRHMGPLNRQGPVVLRRTPLLAPMDASALERAVVGGAWVVDGRDRAAFAEAHLPGSLNIELSESFATYVGWMVPFEAPLVLVLPEPVGEAAVEAATQLLRIGYDRVTGFLAGGVAGWAASGRPTRAYPTATMRDLYDAVVGRGEDIDVLDVRQPAEWRDDGSIPGSRQVFVADLPPIIDELPRDREQWIVCTTGHRASIAASLLDAAGVPTRLIGRGGVIGWSERFEAAAGATTSRAAASR
jgi:hydroxyacylglutathione hydrolase